MSRRNEEPAFTLWQELGRKSIHLAGAVLPAFYVIVGPGIAVPSLVGLAILVPIGDALRIRVELFGRVLGYLFGQVIRSEEDTRLTGASWYVIGQALTALLFPPDVVPVAMTFLILGDTAAALVGRRWGTHTWVPGKTVEGTIAFVVASFAGGAAWFLLPWYVVLVGALAAAAAEVVVRGIDDNLSIPLCGGLVMWALLMFVG
jgi:dolichol kinase